MCSCYSQSLHKSHLAETFSHPSLPPVSTQMILSVHFSPHFPLSHYNDLNPKFLVTVLKFTSVQPPCPWSRSPFVHALSPWVSSAPGRECSPFFTGPLHSPLSLIRYFPLSCGEWLISRASASSALPWGLAPLLHLLPARHPTSPALTLCQDLEISSTFFLLGLHAGPIVPVTPGTPSIKSILGLQCNNLRPCQRSVEDLSLYKDILEPFQLLPNMRVLGGGERREGYH